MSTAKATKRPNGKPAPAKARKPPPTSARAAPEKTRTLGKNAEAKPPSTNLGNAGKGRLKGVPNAITKTAREIFAAFVDHNAAKLQELFDRVAKKSPAKALSIYAKLAEFVIPKLQRTELSGQLDHRVAAITVNKNDPVELSRFYKDMVDGAEINYVDGPTPEQVYRTIFPRHAAPPAAVERPSQPESAPHTAEAAEPETNETNVAVILPKHEGEHRPIVDSKCGFCRKLWVEAQKASQDEALRAQRPPRVVT